MKFFISTDIIQGRIESVDERGVWYYSNVVAEGRTLQECLENYQVMVEIPNSLDEQMTSIDGVSGELRDLIEADLAVQFNKAYQKALAESA